MSDHAPTGLMIVGPSTVTPDEPFTVGIKVLCAPYEAPWACYTPYASVHSPFNNSPRGTVYMDNTPPAFDDRLTVTCPEGLTGPASIDLAGHAGPLGSGDGRPVGRFGPFTAERPGHFTITVSIDGTDLTGTSNVIEATEAGGHKLYFGDTHSQTIFSDGLRTPEQLFAFARDEAFLDFFSLADHMERVTDRQWDYFQAVTDDFEQPGRFATLIGQEWTNKQLGHRNVYYRTHGPAVRSNSPDCDTLEKLFRIARRQGALVIPHHPANHDMGCDWSLGHDPELERLVEIYSIWGNSERPAAAGNPRPITRHGGEAPGRHVADALAMNRRLGFIGSGDIHDGRPGDEFHNLHDEPKIWDGLYRQGLVGVWCTELSREAVFDALWNRRCYATTNNRTIVKFSSGDSPMGSQLAATSLAPLAFEAASEVPIARIDVVKNGEDLVTLEPNEPVVKWTGHDEVGPTPAYYYIRITRADGEMAWCSPIWFG